MTDKILIHTISLQWDKNIVESTAKDLGFGSDPAERKLIKIFCVFAAVHNATGLPLFEDADEVVE